MSNPNTNTTPVLDLHPDHYLLTDPEWIERLAKTKAEVLRRKEIAQPDNTYHFSNYQWSRWLERSVGL